MGSFPPIGLPCPVLIQGSWTCFIASCFVFGGRFLETYSFLKVNGGNIDLGKEGGEGTVRSVERGNLIVDILYERGVYSIVK